jgi:hypothetical protein
MWRRDFHPPEKKTGYSRIKRSAVRALFQYFKANLDFPFLAPRNERRRHRMSNMETYNRSQPQRTSFVKWNGASMRGMSVKNMPTCRGKYEDFDPGTSTIR